MELKAHFDNLKDRANQELDLILQKRPGLPESLLAAMRYSVLAPGKRMRPILTHLGFELCKTPDASSANPWPAACAVELVHVYSLIHDDLPAMDDDDLRRGIPTCHKKFGEALAILAGDGLLTFAFEVVAEAYSGTLGTEMVLELARSSGMTGMVGGQVVDLTWENKIAALNGENAEKSVAELESLHMRKTGALIRGALRLGAMVGLGETKSPRALETLDRLSRFGTCLGLAFQITDDLLDVEGDASKTGKRLGKDATRGKLTYPGLIGIHASRERLDELETQALEVLKPFGENSVALKSLLEKVLRRDH